MVSSSIAATRALAFNAVVTGSGREYCNWPVSAERCMCSWSAVTYRAASAPARHRRRRRCDKSDAEDCVAAAAARISTRTCVSQCPIADQVDPRRTACLHSRRRPFNTACEPHGHRNTGFVVLTARRRRNTSCLRPWEESGSRGGGALGHSTGGEDRKNDGTRSFTVSITSSSFERCPADATGSR